MTSIMMTKVVSSRALKRVMLERMTLTSMNL
jgi:hypothetical protein